MGYRFNDKHEFRDYIKRFPIRNGATAKIAFACYYMRGHNPKRHDHVGWPNPDFPDAICQEIGNLRLFRMQHKTVDFTEIHLLEEGYDSTFVAFDDSPYNDYIYASTSIDPDADNIIRVRFDTFLPEFTDKTIDITFTVFAKNMGSGITDAVCRGVLSIYPGAPYENTDMEDAVIDQILLGRY